MRIQQYVHLGLLPVTSGLLPVIEYESWWSGDNPGAIWIRRILLGKIWWHNLISLILWCLIFRQLNFASTNCLVLQMKSSVLVSWQRPKQDIDTVLWTDQFSAIFTKRIFREFNSLISLLSRTGIRGSKPNGSVLVLEPGRIRKTLKI